MVGQRHATAGRASRCGMDQVRTVYQESLHILMTMFDNRLLIVARDTLGMVALVTPSLTLAWILRRPPIFFLTRNISRGILRIMRSIGL
jgi:hypothetical protein